MLPSDYVKGIILAIGLYLAMTILARACNVW